MAEVPPTVGHFIVGPDQHGVVLFASELADHLGGPRLRLPGTMRAPTMSGRRLGDSLRALSKRSEIVHAQYTDALYAERADVAAQRFVGLRTAIRGPLSVTLHDLPDPADPPERYALRCAAYRLVVSVADAVVVSSRHEARLLQMALGEPYPASVIPLPIEPPEAAGPRREPDRPREVGLVGFLHPGKGYAEAIAELGALPAGLTISALGRPADGHEDLPATLARTAAAAGHHWHLTGFLPKGELLARLRRVAVPLAPNPRVSASGSINSWLAAGRRPLVADGGYPRELAERLPGAVRLYRPGQLGAAVAQALAEPESTWLDSREGLGPDGAGVALAYYRVLTGRAFHPGAPLPGPAQSPMRIR